MRTRQSGGLSKLAGKRRRGSNSPAQTEEQSTWTSPTPDTPLQKYLAAVRQEMFPYQLRWVQSKRRLRVANKARQIRFSTTVAFEAIRDAALLRQRSLIVSASEKNAQDVLDKCRRWLRAAEAVGLTFKLTTDSKSELSFAQGGQILSLAQNPRTVRGFAGNVYLDEFAHHRDDREIYTAILPAISHGYRISILSTPLGQSGLFYEIFSDAGAYRDYERHEIDIHAAIRDGLRIDVDLLRRNMDEESFRQEYLCEFVDEASSYFPYSLIRACIGEPGASGGTVYLGADVGRKRDLTCIYVLRQLTDGRLEVIDSQVMQGVSFAEQRQAIVEMWQRHKVQRGCMDATGMGMQLAEEMQATHGLMEPVVFTAQIKEQLATMMKRHLEARTLTIPEDRDLINDIHSVRKTVTPSNNVRFDADRTEKGHADRFWALALACHAASNGNEPGVWFL